MDAHELKDKIKIDNKLFLILDKLNMHHIQLKDNKYYMCGMPDGDNTHSTVIYIDTLIVEAYTRNIVDKFGISDILSLVSFVKKTYITQSIKWVCEICGYSYYENKEKQPECLKWLDEIYKMNTNSDEEDEITYLKPLDESVLNYYGFYQNQMFLNDGISLQTQREFELGYDLETHSITIPIRDELGTLIGVKARLYKDKINKHESKYFYLYRCAKSKILYGLHKTYPYIKRQGEVIIVEAEKGCQQLWSHGIKNTVAIGGHKLSDTQVKKLTHLGVDIVFAYDQGVGLIKDTNKIDKKFYENEFSRFVKNQGFSVIFDKNGNVLNEKESPSDNIENFKKLYEERIIINRS
jgi:hypothetical protein